MPGYTFDNAWTHELERLRALEAQRDPETIRHLVAIGVASGWQCLEIGDGAGSIATWLCDSVGPQGRVVAADVDPRFVQAIDRSNLEVRTLDIVREQVESDAFDLVHARFVLEHLPARAEVMRKLVAALRPEGWILLGSIDALAVIGLAPGVRFVVPDAKARMLDRFLDGFYEFWATQGFSPGFARSAPERLIALGLEDVGAEQIGRMVIGGSSFAEFQALTLEQMKDRLVSSGSLTAEEIEECLSFYRDPDARWMSPPAVYAWGRRPKSS
jgi:2-polyprenyl-3-methyl-5-hydroxy-6-metoxy-1,4-benzoquinol methylase